MPMLFVCVTLGVGFTITDSTIDYYDVSNQISNSGYRHRIIKKGYIMKRVSFFENFLFSVFLKISGIFEKSVFGIPGVFRLGDFSWDHPRQKSICPASFSSPGSPMGPSYDRFYFFFRPGDDFLGRDFWTR